MRADDAIELIGRRLIALVRELPISPDGDRTIDHFAAGGIDAIEVSFVHPAAPALIAHWRERHHGALVGAGTVRTAAQARAAIDSGAAFLVSPGACPAVADVADSAGVLHIPGVFSASEVDGALQRDVPILKLFPAGAMGPRYVSDLLAPFPEATFLVSGGVNVDNAAAFLAAGARLVCVGGPLASPLRLGVELPARIAELVATTSPGRIA
jgi:2-dehydro-3-deoxyphosphogluconate aldolase/(4S)-4-hydroxy-2-oxoglutarate aldolase